MWEIKFDPEQLFEMTGYIIKEKLKLEIQKLDENFLNEIEILKKNHLKNTQKHRFHFSTIKTKNFSTVSFLNLQDFKCLNSLDFSKNSNTLLSNLFMWRSIILENNFLRSRVAFACSRFLCLAIVSLSSEQKN
jgi:hypothetical protein